MILYGIPNCDTVRKARKFLDTHNIHYHFHDFRKDGLDQDKIKTWLTQKPIEVLVNKRSTSWKQLTDGQKEQLLSSQDLSVLTELPTLIKRPILEANNALFVGFKATEYETLI